MLNLAFKSMRSDRADLPCLKRKGKFEVRSTKTLVMMRVTAVFLVLPVLLLNCSTWAEREISDLMDIARERIRCVSDPKCIDKTGVCRLLRVTNLKAADPNDISIVLAHHVLHGNASCTVQLPNIRIVEKEVMRAIETEDIQGIIRTFKRILKDGGKKECIGEEGILKEINVSKSDAPMHWLRSVISVLMGHVMKGHCLEDRLATGNSLDNLFSQYGDICSPYMSAKGLGKMMHDLENTGNEHNHHHHNDHHHPHHHHHHHESEENVEDCDHHHDSDSHRHEHDHDYSIDHNHIHPNIHNSGISNNHNHDHLNEPYHDHSNDHNHDHSNEHHDHSNEHNHDHSSDHHHGHDHDDPNDHNHTEHSNKQLNSGDIVSHHNNSEYSHHHDNSTKHNGHDHDNFDYLKYKHNDNNNHNDHSHDHENSNHNDFYHHNDSVHSSHPHNELTKIGHDDINGFNQSDVYNKNFDHDQNRTEAEPKLLGTNSDIKRNNSDYNENEPEDTEHIISVVSKDGNSSSSDAINETLKIDIKHMYVVAKPENLTEEIENIVASRLSDLWHPTTLASEESNVVSKMILPQNSFSSFASQCLSAESLISHYGSDKISLSKAEFLRLCPVLVQQTVGDNCDEPSVELTLPSKLEVYGYSTLCVLALCMTSFSGILLYPLMQKKSRHYVIAFFQGLAFSTLATDALIHQMPEFLGLHSHSHGHSHAHEEESFPEKYTQLMLCFFGTLYVLFNIEAIVCALSGPQTRGHSHTHGHGHGHGPVRDLSSPTLASMKKNETSSQLPMTDQSCSSLDTEIIDVDVVKKPPNLMVAQPVVCGLTSLAFVITVGDALHNFGDGLAIGAAFSSSIYGGLSTAIAAVFHEVPHELGDFIVLLSTGLSYSRALSLNFLSALTCFAGLYLGILTGDYQEARNWVMAVTSSTFIYVALAEMIPELRVSSNGQPFKMLLLRNIGMLLGVVVMIGISLLEHALQ